MLEQVAYARGDDDRRVLQAQALRLRRVWTRWQWAESHQWDLRHRWEDATRLADICVRVVSVAAHQRGLTLIERASVAGRLHETARLLANIDPGRAELLRTALDLARCAGGLPSVEPPCTADVERTIESLMTGIALAATVVDPEHPAIFHRWLRRWGPRLQARCGGTSVAVESPARVADIEMIGEASWLPQLVGHLLGVATLAVQAACAVHDGDLGATRPEPPPTVRLTRGRRVRGWDPDPIAHPRTAQPLWRPAAKYWHDERGLGRSTPP